MTVASDKKISLGPYTSKIHKEELLELLDLWEFGPGVKEKIGALIDAEAGQLKGPHLFRYYNPRPSKVAAAEKAFAEFLGAKNVLAVNSCTSALIAAVRALGIGMGDEVIVPAYTFFASAAVVGASNAIPVIADVDDTLTLDPKDVERTKRALAALHTAGVPAGAIYDHNVKDWHIYTYWEHILEKKFVARDGLPWTGVPTAELPHYSRTMCPQCSDYLSRAIMVDIHWQYSKDDCAAMVGAINKVLARL